MKKIIITIIFLLCTLLIITACSTERFKNDPEISLKFNVYMLQMKFFKDKINNLKYPFI